MKKIIKKIFLSFVQFYKKKSIFVIKYMKSHPAESILYELVNDKHIAIVGNGPHELGKRKGKEIDEKDIVVRFNTFNLSGYENDYGERTDIWFNGTGDGYQKNKYLKTAINCKLVVFRCINYKGKYFKKIINFWYKCIKNGVKLALFSDNITQELFLKLKRLSGEDINPTAGAIFIYWILKYANPECIYFYGFSFINDNTECNNHTHFYNLKFKHDIKAFHNYNVEKEYLRKLVDEKNYKNSEDLFIVPESDKKQLLRLAHIGLHKNGNAGDTLIFPALRSLMQKQLGPIKFSLINLKDTVTQDTIDLINCHDGVIIGGGGLFLKDTNPNNISGWQWACPEYLLEKITVPIIVFAVGYNRFRGQEDFDDVFKNNLNLLVKKSSFFSLRHNGDIEQIKKYLVASLHEKVLFQPCPTTVLSKFYPIQNNKILQENKTIAFNIPFDRKNMRYDNKEDEIFNQFAASIAYIKKNNYNVVLYNMHHLDNEATHYLDKHKVNIPEINLSGIPPDAIIDLFQKIDAIIGGRGHSQMISFGLNMPTFSLISHDKLKYFLDDIKHPEWGEEVLSPLLEKKINDFVDSLQNETIQSDLEEAQNILWDITMANIERIKQVFSGKFNNSL